MGRGRAKAKQTKVARELKYHSPNTDLAALQRELAVTGPARHPTPMSTSSSEFVDEDSDTDDDDDDEDGDWACPQVAAHSRASIRLADSAHDAPSPELYASATRLSSTVGGW